MEIPAQVAPFWNAFLASTPGASEERFYEAFYFADSEELAESLGDLVLRGIKRATASSRWSFEAEGKRLPAPGDLSVMTGWSGDPLAIIETTSIVVVPFREVTAQLAATEGEGDGSLAYWREAHRDYFTRECERAGRQFDEDMLVVCECFSVVHPPAVADRRQP